MFITFRIKTKKEKPDVQLLFSLLSIFFSSKVFFIVLYNRFCREQLERFAKGIRQRNLGVECIEKLRLPILSITLQIKLNELITESFSLLENANSIYKSSVSANFI